MRPPTIGEQLSAYFDVMVGLTIAAIWIALVLSVCTGDPSHPFGELGIALSHYLNNQE